MSGEDGNPQGADFVTHITIGRYPIRPGNDQVNVPLGHHRCGHIVTNECDINACLHQFPTCQPCSLQ